MNFASVPIIVILCYILGEIYKIIFKNKKETYKLIPLLVSLFGGILGVLIYFTAPEILNVDNIYLALEIGVISGSSATGTNQIIKQIFKNKEEENENKN
ncbi:putative uncharacterized protein [Firmicutes bacterium CAG:449]|nr:putative uncharacterized protein [Firmicutes bacterium CAG:449]